MAGQERIDPSTSSGGFTGVVWQSRPTEKLAADLADGSGPAPLAEAGLAWATLAEEVAQVGLEYVRILTDLGVHWESATSNGAIERLTRFAPWFADTAAKIVETSGKAEVQAAANTVALAAMPSLPEIAVVTELGNLLSRPEVMLGAPMVAATAKNDRIKHELAQHAARVMESYERASVPAAMPWKIGRAPELVRPDALAAERAATAAARNKPAESSAVGGAGLIGGVGGLGGGAGTPREKTRYVATSLASTAAAPTPAPAPAGDVARTASMVPPMAPMTTNAGQSGSVARPIRTASVSPEASSAGVRLPEGWLSNGDGSPTSWTEVAQQIDSVEQRPLLKGEGVLNLGPAAPAVIGEADGDGER